MEKEIEIQYESEVLPPVYWIEERSESTGRWCRLINCDYSSQLAAQSNAQSMSYNEGRRLRVVEVKETMIAYYV